MDNTTYISNEEADLFPNEAAKIVSIVTLAVIIFLTVVGNLLVIFSVIVFARLQTVTNYFVTSLAVADFLVGAVVLPFSTAYIYIQEWFYGVTWCNLWVSIDVCVCTASVLNLFAIAVDRYIAITSPFQYHIRMSPRNAAVAIAFVWVASVMMSVFPIMSGLNTTDYNIQNIDTPNACGFETNPYYTVIVGILAFWIPLIGMCLVYLSLFRTARTQARRIAAMDKAVAANNPNGTQAKRERKAAKTLGIIMGCFLVCWGPYIVYWTLSDVCKINVSYDGLNAMTWMGYLNSTLNPLIYAFFNKEFRRAFQKLLSCGKCQQLPSKWKDTVLHEPTQLSNAGVPMHIPVSDS
uniref:Tyramine receptor 2-like n=1 Tax=Saccoglossus kowalevskii TaxID=10224 RepID=A0ABM0GYA8_SACKO|nr:PREDICTED: putative tyramine receptor 2-like [Saccoglossus kowalevskii]